MNSSSLKDLGITLLFAVFFSFPIFGQQLIGPENVNSARAMTMLAEVIAILFWLSRKNFSLTIPDLTSLEKMLFGIWVFFAVLAVVFSDHVFVSAIRQLEWFTHLLFFIALLSCFRDYNGQAGLFVFSIALAFLIIGVYLLFIWHTMDNPRQHDWFRHPFVFGHVRHLAFFAVAGFCASFYPLFKFPPVSPYWLVITVLLSSFCLSFVFWGGGRASILAALISSLFLIVAAGNEKRILLTKFLVVVLLISSVLSIQYEVEDQRMGLSLNHGRELESSNQISSGRFGIWGRVLSETAERPFTGMGPDGYLFMPGKNIETLHPHSFVVQFIGDWGWVGAIAFIVFLFSVIGKRFILILRKKTLYSPSLIIASTVVLSLSLLGLVDGTYYHSWSIMLLASGIAVMFCPLTTEVAPTKSADHSTLRRPISVFTLALVGLVGFQVSVSAIVLSPKIPSPQSFRATWVRSFPSNTLGMDRWIRNWFSTYPQETLDWTRWLQKNSKDGWYYYFLESEFQKLLGENKISSDLFRIGLS